MTVLFFISPLLLHAQGKGVASPSQSSKSDNIIKFQVGFPKNLPAGLTQKWLIALTNAGADGIRLVYDPDLALGLTEEKSQSKLTIHVAAKINAKHDLVIEGDTYRLSHVEELKRWIQKVKKIDSVDPARKKGAFGLTASELVDVYEILGKPYPDSTRRRTVSEVVTGIRRHLGAKIGADVEALEAIQESAGTDSLTLVPEEMKGLSCGTVLAAVIRPLGLVLVIGRDNGQFRIVATRNATEHWPVGWPLQKRPGQIAPILYKQTEIEIEGYTLDEVLEAIEGKTGIPFLFDQNSMARQGTELDKINIRLGRTKTYYEKLIRLCLNQSDPRLKYELRADERGNPFFWISH